MQQKNEYHSFIGMQTDTTVSKHPNNMLLDARNIRLTQREDSTLLAVTNEKGTLLTSTEVTGYYLGHCLLDNYLVVFSKDADNNIDYIKRIDLRIVNPWDLGDYSVYLFKGNLNFHISFPIEAIASYENEKVQKVYWTDGYNQPRVINIVADVVDESSSTEVYKGYDFVMTLKLEETVTVEKMLGASGMFPAGVIQYAFTYYMKYGQETSVFYTTPLLYTSYKERGGSPEDTVENAFRIKVDNLDTSFDYLRIYSIVRTSINGTPMCKRVQDIDLSEVPKDTITNKYYTTFIDTGHEGDTVDPNELLYKGGEVITAGTIEQKDGTLFLGDLTLKRNSLRQCTPQVIPQEGQEEQEAQGNIREPFHWVWEPSDISVGGTNSGTSTGSGGSSGSGGNADFQPPVNGGDVIDPGELVDTTDSTESSSLPQEGETLEEYIHRLVTIGQSSRKFFSPKVFNGSYDYGNQLTSYNAVLDNSTYVKGDHNVPCSGFKRGDYYRCGVQFQHESGKWSDPVWIDDVQVTGQITVNNATVTLPTIDGEIVTVPTLKGTVPAVLSASLLSLGYKNVRAVVVFPEMQDRVVLCQGVANPTMLRLNESGDVNIYQSSWFFRPSVASSIPIIKNSKTVVPAYVGDLPYASESTSYDPSNIKSVEIQGVYTHGFKERYDYVSLHSPDVEFDDAFYIADFDNTGVRKVGQSVFSNTLSDIEIQTSTPAISSLGDGFQKKSFVNNSIHGIVSGLFYDDFLVEDVTESGNLIYKVWGNQKSPVKYMIYPWQKDGSLNNDVKRPADKGVSTAELKKKIISNLRYSDTAYFSPSSSFIPSVKTQVFSSDQQNLLKVGPIMYNGNVDTMLIPDKGDGVYFAFAGSSLTSLDEYGNPIETPFDTDILYKTFSKKEGTNDNQGVWKCIINGNTASWAYVDGSAIGNEDVSLVRNKGNVRMKYKSSPHAVVYNYDDGNTKFTPTVGSGAGTLSNGLCILEIVKPGDTVGSYYRTTMFGGTSEDAFKANTWLPCGDPVLLNASNDVDFEYSYGDTYYQRWDCLKTYAYTQEDINQVVEIGSFMLETRINIDGRYDRNRGQVNNLYMSPTNFNLLNKVYSQQDNFFAYKILDKSQYANNNFPNQITWTKEKKAGADVDLWTNLTLASTIDMDGSKGKVVSLNDWNNYLYCFQNKGIGVVLFNSRVQIPVSDGIPIEITNGYKVDGYKYVSDGIGCTNKWTIKETPGGVYFVDSIKGDLCALGEGVVDLAEKLSMRNWFKNKYIEKVVYDEVNNDVYSLCRNDALCYSEKLANFTSVMDYGGINLMESCNKSVFALKNNSLYKLFSGEYNDFFGTKEQTPRVSNSWYYSPNYKPWWIKFISNGSSESLMTLDKIFTNIDYRLDFSTYSLGDAAYIHNPSQTFDFLNVTDEYQKTSQYEVDDNTTVSNKKNLSQLKATGISQAVPYTSGNPQKKFRQWRIQIPRALKLKNSQWIASNDRIRNPWCEITLGKLDVDDSKAVLQDLVVQYYI